MPSSGSSTTPSCSSRWQFILPTLALSLWNIFYWVLAVRSTRWAVSWVCIFRSVRSWSTRFEVCSRFSSRCIPTSASSSILSLCYSNFFWNSSLLVLWYASPFVKSSTSSQTDSILLIWHLISSNSCLLVLFIWCTKSPIVANPLPVNTSTVLWWSTIPGTFTQVYTSRLSFLKSDQYSSCILLWIYFIASSIAIFVHDFIYYSRSLTLVSALPSARAIASCNSFSALAAAFLACTALSTSNSCSYFSKLRACPLHSCLFTSIWSVTLCVYFCHT